MLWWFIWLLLGVVDRGVVLGRLSMLDLLFLVFEGGE